MIDAELQKLFTFAPLSPEEQEKIGALREQGYRLAKLANDLCPDGPLKVAAIHDLHRAVMSLNACVARG